MYSLPPAARPVPVRSRPAKLSEHNRAMCQKREIFWCKQKARRAPARSDRRLGGEVRPAGRRAAAARRRVRLAAVAAFVAMALDLARQLLAHELERVHDLWRGVARTQCHALQVQRRLCDVAVGHTRIGLAVDLY